MARIFISYKRTDKEIVFPPEGSNRNGSGQRDVLDRFGRNRKRHHAMSKISNMHL